MDVKTIKEIQAELLNIQKYFIKIFDKNVFVIWTSPIASSKYRLFSEAMNRMISILSFENEMTEDGFIKTFQANSGDLNIICKAVFDLDISGYDYAHQIFEDSFLSEARVEAINSACKIADTIGLAEEEMVNGLD